MYGVQELEGKNTNDVIIRTFKKEMNINMREEDLDLTNPVGNPKVSKKGKPRSIIIKFAYCDMRNTRT